MVDTIPVSVVASGGLGFAEQLKCENTVLNVYVPHSFWAMENCCFHIADWKLCLLGLERWKEGSILSILFLYMVCICFCAGNFWRVLLTLLIWNGNLHLHHINNYRIWILYKSHYEPDITV